MYTEYLKLSVLSVGAFSLVVLAIWALAPIVKSLLTNPKAFFLGLAVVTAVYSLHGLAQGWF